MDDLKTVEVVDARPEAQRQMTIQVSAASTLQQAALQSELLAATDRAPLGVFGRVRPSDTLVSDGDRIEIYRPLINDPKQARRQRASKHR